MAYSAAGTLFYCLAVLDYTRLVSARLGADFFRVFPTCRLAAIYRVVNEHLVTGLRLRQISVGYVM